MQRAGTQIKEQVVGCGKVVIGFKDFVLRGNVIDLAVAVVLGTAFNSVVTSFVQAFITPFITLIGGADQAKNLTFHIKTTAFPYGSFLDALLAFLVVAAVCYFIFVAPMNTLLKSYTKTTTKECPWCLTKVPLAARRCKDCTSILDEEARGPSIQIGSSRSKPGNAGDGYVVLS